MELVVLVEIWQTIFERWTPESSNIIENTNISLKSSETAALTDV